MDPDELTQGQEPPQDVDAANPTRLAAVIVLLVATPLLLLTGLALGLFFVAPERFNDFLAQLPGEAAIRTVMIFAPAALIAIIVLAVLYAAEPPAEMISRTQPSAPVAPAAAKAPGIAVADLAGWVLGVGTPLLLALVAVRSAGFLSPDRFQNFLERLPAAPLIELLMGVGFPVLGILVFLALAIFFNRTPLDDDQPVHRAGRWLWEAGPARLGVGMVLIFSIPLLILSLLALTGFLARPSRVLDLLTQLPKEVILRLGLLFGPSSLFIVVVLAMLFLIRRSTELGEGAESVEGLSLTRLSQSLYGVGSWILLWGLLVACASVLGLAVGVLVLVLR